MRHDPGIAARGSPKLTHAESKLDPLPDGRLVSRGYLTVRNPEQDRVLGYSSSPGSPRGRVQSVASHRYSGAGLIPVSLRHSSRHDPLPLLLIHSKRASHPTQLLLVSWRPASALTARTELTLLSRRGCRVSYTTTTIIGSFIAAGGLEMRGIGGVEGWRYLFLVRGTCSYA